MKTLAAVLALCVLSMPTAARAEDETSACSAGYVVVMSAGGPLCVNPIYLSAPWQNPAECTNGYFLGSCVLVEYAELPAVVFEPESYDYQPTPAPVAVVERVVADDALCIVQHPC